MSKRWDDHSEFLGELAGHVAYLMLADGDDRANAIEDYTNWLSNVCFNYAEKHAEDDKKVPPVHFGGKSVPKDASMGKVVAERRYPVDGWQSFEE